MAGGRDWARLSIIPLPFLPWLFVELVIIFRIVWSRKAGIDLDRIYYADDTVPHAANKMWQTECFVQ